MHGRLRELIQGDQNRLLGHAPLLQAVEYHRVKWQLLSRVTLSAADKKHAIGSSFSFTVDRELIAMLRVSDVLHVSRTHCAGLGLSILRDGELVAAVGAVIDVPLGATVTVRHPREMIEEAEGIFRARDPEYHMRNYPVELRVGDVLRITHQGRPTIGDYEVLVRHGTSGASPAQTNVCPSSGSGSARARQRTTRRS